MASATLWNPYPSPMFDANGVIAGGALAYFYSAGTLAPLTIYTDPALAVPGTNPAVAAGNGVFNPIYLPYVDYRVIVTTSTGTEIFAADGIANPPPPADVVVGISVTQQQVFQTGWPIWLLKTGAVPGFVRMNGRTVGSAASAAVERANADVQALYISLWDNLTDTEAAVSTGRGSSGLADFAANKTIVVPTMQGLVARGVDDMGAAAALNIQSSTTCTTDGTDTVIVVSAGNLAIGMNAIVNGVGGRTILAISGANVQLSSAVAGVAAGISFRASQFGDAQIIGTKITKFTHSQLLVELKAHSHTITDPGHVHVEEGVQSVATVAAAAGVNLYQTQSKNTASATTGITATNNSGGGLPMPLLTSSRLGTWYIKL